MLTNHYSIDENTSVGAFLKGMNEKKNIHYIILNTDPKAVIDVRTFSLKIHNREEKLKNLKKNLAWTDAKTNEELVSFLINTGDYVIEHEGGYYDFLQGLETIRESKVKLLHMKMSEIAPREIYALNSNDSIASAKALFTQKKINILPVIDNLELIGEVRTNDLLASNLFEKNDNKDFYNENHENSVFSLSIENLINTKPITITKEDSVKAAIDVMIQKKLPSIIIVDESNQIYSIISFKDIFNLYKRETKDELYDITFVGEDVLYEDELRMVRGFTIRSMDKIIKMSNYKNLKIVYKIHGDKESSHMRKGELNITLDAGGKVISVSKEIHTGTSDEEFNDKVKGKWNLAKLTQEALKVLETKVIEEKDKK
jgi:CBS domain-containing protein